MTNKKRLCLATVCMILGCTMFASCSKKNKTAKEETEVVFSEAIIPIKMVVPDNWVTTTGFKRPNHSDDFLATINHTVSMHLDNSLKESLDGENGLNMTLTIPYYTGNKDVKSIIPNIETTQKQKCGNNDVYISVPPRTGFVYIDSKYVLKIFISHWPKNGITPEIESFFSSLHID